MNVLRSVLSWISLYLVGTFFFLSATLFALAHVISAANIKQTLNEQGTYSKIVPAVLSTARYSESNGVGQLPLGDKGIQDAVNKAFPASDLQQKGDTAIDSTFAWLEGKTEKPEFSLDFSSNKTQLGQEIGSYAENRLSDLPKCTRANIPSSLDAYKIECLPPGISPEAVGSGVGADVSGSQNLLKNPVITADSIGEALGGAGQEQPLRLDGLREFYQNKDLLLWALPLLTVTCAAAGMALARDRSAALRRLSRTFLGAAVGLLLFAALLNFGFESLVEATARDAISKDILGPVMVALAHQMAVVYMIFAVLAAALGLGALLYRKRKL